MTDEQRRVAAKRRVRVCRYLWVAPLVINSDEVDFLDNSKDLGNIVSSVQGEIHGLF